MLFLREPDTGNRIFLHRLSYTYLLLLFRSEYNVLHTCYIFIVCMCSTICNLIEVLISLLRNLLFPFTCNTIPKFACDEVSFPSHTYPLALPKFFGVKSVDPHVKICVKRWVHTNFERLRSIAYHAMRALKLAILRLFRLKWPASELSWRGNASRQS